MLAKIHGFLEKISTVAVWCGGGALLICAVMVTLDVISRKAFAEPPAVGEEYCFTLHGQEESL